MNMVTGRRRLALFFAVSVLIPVVAAPASAQDVKWGPHIDLEAKPGTKRSLGEADLFVPLTQNADTLLFASLRFRMDDNDSNEGNYGLGIRHMLDSGWNLGGYGYFDRRRTDYGNYFHQTTVGVEALSQDWDLRANYYAPVGRRSHQVDSLSTAEISGTSVIFRGGEERSLGGFDAEIGWRVPVFAADAAQQFRVYGGGYRFADDGVPDIEGPRARAEMTFDSVPGLWDGSRFSIGAEWQHDDPRGSQGFLSARLRIPLQVYGRPASKQAPMERRMADPVVRDVDIVSQAGAFGPAEVATQTAAGGAITILSSASTTGVDLPTAVTNAGANSTVILTGTFNTANPVFVEAGQSLMGSGALTVRSASGRTATVALPGATIDGGGVVLSNGGGSVLSGMNIVRTGGIGVVADFDASVTGNTIIVNATGADPATGIAVGGANVRLIGNTITATADTGNAQALFLNGATNIQVSGNRLSAAGGGASDAAFVNTVTFAAGSTGNVLVTGICSPSGVNTGSIGFTNGTCPP